MATQSHHHVVNLFADWKARDSKTDNIKNAELRSDALLTVKARGIMAWTDVTTCAQHDGCMAQIIMSFVSIRTDLASMAVNAVHGYKQHSHRDVWMVGDQPHESWNLGTSRLLYCRRVRLQCREAGPSNHAGWACARREHRI